ncbi:MAG TPA: hypothetical protein VMV49_02335, partial [Candidatus Deferrimicrobium sp.]|nr:hypothetical protein [Candidatus Deferrimicrobium sp.]
VIKTPQRHTLLQNLCSYMYHFNEYQVLRVLKNRGLHLLPDLVTMLASVSEMYDEGAVAGIAEEVREEILSVISQLLVLDPQAVDQVEFAQLERYIPSDTLQAEVIHYVYSRAILRRLKIPPSKGDLEALARLLTKKSFYNSLVIHKRPDAVALLDDILKKHPQFLTQLVETIRSDIGKEDLMEILCWYVFLSKNYAFVDKLYQRGVNLMPVIYQKLYQDQIETNDQLETVSVALECYSRIIRLFPHLGKARIQE